MIPRNARFDELRRLEAAMVMGDGCTTSGSPDPRQLGPAVGRCRIVDFSNMEADTIWP
jgi:hypothetical protein